MVKAKFTVAVTVILLSGLLLNLSEKPHLISPAFASPDEVRWSRVNIPTQSKPGGWVLASGSDVQHLAAAIDGTLYASANPSATGYTLFKSTNGGYSWSYTGKVTDTIADIATTPDNASIIYYASGSCVYKSTDGGASFVPLPPGPGGAGSSNVEITSIDVTPVDNGHMVAAGTRDSDNLEFGGVYILDENKPFSGWTDTSLSGYDVYAVAFSPDFTDDGQLVAVATDETDTIITTKISSTDWGGTVGNATLDKDNSAAPTPVAVSTSATIVFPDSYSSDAASSSYVQFVAIDAGSDMGDVYMVCGVEAPASSIAIDLNIGTDYGLGNVDVTGLDICGDTLMAGAAQSSQVYFSNDSGTTWERSRKPPTGQSQTCVLTTGSRTYCATSGSESAFSVSQDSGTTYAQVGLIDTTVNNIIDLVPSPSYNQDDTLFMLTWDGEYSLWRSQDDAVTWERVLSSALPDIDSIDLVGLSPQYGAENEVVFIAGTSNGNPAIWKSIDNGQNFQRRTTRNPTTGNPFPIDTWAIAGDSTLFIGSYDGVNGLVYRTTNGGLSYLTPAVAGSQPLSSTALSPDYEQDETILAGNTNGWVYRSGDNGASFEPLPADAALPPLTGSIRVAFDPGYKDNHTVYAASNTADKGIYRFITTGSGPWKGIDSTLPAGGMVNTLKVAVDGTLYAVNGKADGGMERCLNPTYPLGPTFETVTRGLDSGATLAGLWLYENRLWSTDTTNIRVMTFTDSLSAPVIPISPPNKGAGTGTITNDIIRNASLDWEVLSGATGYRWQLDYDTDFSTIPAGFEGTTKASSARLPALEPATTYHWRVRATEPVLSRWAEVRSFTTSLGDEASAPQLKSPKAGADGVSVRPVLQWSAIAGAESYELLVSSDTLFTNPAVARTGACALPTTAWQCQTDLSYATTYYWKVKAISSSSCSPWSATGTFSTKSPPSESPPAPAPPPQPTTPEWVNWLIYLGIGLLGVMIGILTMLIILTVRGSKS